MLGTVVLLRSSDMCFEGAGVSILSYEYKL